MYTPYLLHYLFHFRTLHGLEAVTEWLMAILVDFGLFVELDSNFKYIWRTPGKENDVNANIFNSKIKYFLKSGQNFPKS